MTVCQIIFPRKHYTNKIFKFPVSCIFKAMFKRHTITSFTNHQSILIGQFIPTMKDKFTMILPSIVGHFHLRSQQLDSLSDIATQNQTSVSWSQLGDTMSYVFPDHIHGIRGLVLRRLFLINLLSVFSVWSIRPEFGLIQVFTLRIVNCNIVCEQIYFT